MKKFLTTLILSLFLMSSLANAGPIGRGELKLKPTAVKAFIKYIKMKDKPSLFLVPIDGSFNVSASSKELILWLGNEAYK